ncbi:MAG: Uma2 family endonuclease [Gemmatimonadetes bacterium]|nr:Uma2 family endonuclease [Gemmatimonadota bacterium]
MPAPSPANEWTLEMLHALPEDGKRYELVDGQLLVSPSPSAAHQDVIGALYRVLWPWARQHGFDVYFAPLAITFSPRRELQPDLFVVPFIDGRRTQDPKDLTRLVLAIEVLSPSTARYDRVVKRPVYLEQGAAEYWIVDLDSRTVERWLRGEERPELLDTSMSWTPPGAPAALDIDLADLFRLALD